MIALLLAFESDFSNPNYITLAHYPAMSMSKDELASGHSNSGFAAQKIRGGIPDKAFKATLAASSQGVRLTLQAGQGDGVWFRAADGSILGWLEALDGDKWRPIEARHFISCGNSYHRVFLDSGYQWQYDKRIPNQGPKRKIRWRSTSPQLDGSTSKTPGEKPTHVTSNEIEMRIPDTRFMLPAINRHFYRLDVDESGAVIGYTDSYRPSYAIPPLR